MDIVELKNRVLNNTLSNDPIIFKYKDNKFLCYHYIDAICKNKNKQKLAIDSLDNISDNDSLFEEESKYIFIYETDKLSETITNENKDLIIVCQEVLNDLAVDIVEMPKTISWQIEEYVKARLPGLDELEVKWLCEISKYDIYRLDNECKKLELFNKQEQEQVFNLLSNDNNYSDLSPLTIFNLTNALIKKDLKTLGQIVNELSNMDVEAMGITTILTRQFKNLIDVQLNPRNTAESLNMSPKQFNAIRYNIGKFSDRQLINIYEFLTDIDYRLKNGELTLFDSASTLINNRALVEYIITHLLVLIFG